MTDADRDGSPLVDEDIDPVWTAIRALLSAHTATTAALEHLCVQVARGDQLDTATAQRLLAAALEEHRRALEDVEFAHRVVDSDADQRQDS